MSAAATATAEVMPSITDELDALGTIGLLKAIAAGEAEGGRRLLDWANLTKQPKVADTLRFIVARERSHADVFSRRVSELGDSVDLDVVPEQAAYLVMLADPAILDHEKSQCILGGEDFLVCFISPHHLNHVNHFINWVAVASFKLVLLNLITGRKTALRRCAIREAKTTVVGFDELLGRVGKMGGSEFSCGLISEADRAI